LLLNQNNLILNIKFFSMENQKKRTPDAWKDVVIDSTLDRFLTIESPIIQEKIKSFEDTIKNTNFLEVVGKN